MNPFVNQLGGSSRGAQPGCVWMERQEEIVLETVIENGPRKGLEFFDRM